MSYGGPGFPYEEFRNAIYRACLECRDLGLNVETDPGVDAILDKHLEPFRQWRL